METKTEKTTTIWIGMTETQKSDLLQGILIIQKNESVTEAPQDLRKENLEAFDALRLALLNV